MRKFDRFGRDSASRSSGTLIWTQTLYDSLNRVRKSWHTGINNDTTIIVYDDLYPVRSWPGTGGTVTYTYDLDGNVATRTHGGVTDSLFWSATNELDSMRSGGTRLVYEYNSMGQLVRRQRNGVYDRFLLWDGTHLVAELNATGGRIAQYLYNEGVDQPFALATDSGGTTIVRYYYQDPQGNMLGIVRSRDLVRYTPYTPWGLSDSSATTTLTTMKDTSRVAWKGALYEGDSTKLFYMRNRWYDPQAGGLGERVATFLAGGNSSGTQDFGIPGYFASGLNPTGQFVGSYQWSMARSGIILDITIKNTTTKWSAFYHIPIFDPNPPTRTGWSPMGRINQTSHIQVPCP